MGTVREAAVAGRFYPGEVHDLRHALNTYLVARGPVAAGARALIVPHAGYVYSGPIAGAGYARLAAARDLIHRVVLFGPSHHVGFEGLATTSADAFATPLGNVPVDRQAVSTVLTLPSVCIRDDAHAQEHSLEVHLPFLQELLGDFRIVPLVVGHATADDVEAVIELLWDGNQTLFVISSDLSHYHAYDTAQRMDLETSQAIEALAPEKIRADQACGRIPICGLLQFARKHHLHAETIDLRNSGDTAGPRDEVVGYGAYVIR